MIALKIENLSFSYDKEILSNLSVDINENSITALLGPNGTGKTTFIDIITKNKETSSNIFLFNKPLNSYTKKEFGETVAIVPQLDKHTFNFSCLDFVLFGRTPYLNYLESPKKKDILIARNAIDMVGLSECENRGIVSLSGGEYQLILLARAIAQEAKILILDEPSSALDPGNKAVLASILLKLNKMGKTILFTTHDATFASNVATHVTLIKNGKIYKNGVKEDVLTSENLSSLYNCSINVINQDGKIFIS